MRVNPATERARKDHPQAGTGCRTGLFGKPSLELLDTAATSLGVFSALDDSLLDALVERMLPGAEGLGSRLWNQGGVCLRQGEAYP